jgi:hypothetical protein
MQEGGVIMTCVWKPDTKAVYEINKADYTAPVQSIMRNCILIAGLSSLAWVRPTFFLDLGEHSTYSFKFYYNTIPVTAGINSNLFIDNTSGLWCCATSKMSTANEHEAWPAWVEKAYAKFCLYKIKSLISLESCGNTAIEPDYSRLPNGSDWGGNSVTVMKYLTGSTNFKISSPIDASFSFRGVNYNTYYDFIRNGIADGASIVAPKNGAMTKYPAGAWTYLNETAAKQKNGGVTITYSNTTLVADHCYSLLGVFENSPYKYVVLRNPFGASDPDPQKVSLGSGTWSYSRKVYEPWGTQKLGTVPTTESRILGDPDGIFALEQSVFRNYFEQFGFIY